VSPIRQRLLLAALLAAGTLAVFAAVRGFDFVEYDDAIYVTQNPHLEKGLSQAGLRWAFTPYETNWVPLTWISLLVDHELWGKQPAGYHITNLALHVLCVVLLFWVLAGMTGAPGRSAFVAAVFAWHPLHVESVAWVAERKDVLSGLFWMLTLAAWAAYARRPGALRYLVVLLSLGVGLLAKAVGVTLPAVLLLLDFWPLGRLTDAAGRFDAARVRRAVLEKLPMLPLIAAIAAVTYWVQEEKGAMSTFEEVPLFLRVTNALLSYVAYLRDALWPADLAVFYPLPEGAVPLWQWVGAATLLAAATAGALVVWRRRPYLTVGWLWYLGTLVPMIGLVQVGMQARADRYTYLPLIGPSIAIAWGAWALVERSPTRARSLVAGAAGVALAALAATSRMQLEHWRDSERLFAHALAVTHDNFLANQALGGLRMRRGDVEGALPPLAEAVRLKPHWADARVLLADAMAAQGRLDLAILNYGEAVDSKPRDVSLRMHFGQALVKRGWHDEALNHYGVALRLDAGDKGLKAATIHTLIGLAWSARGDARQAAAHYEQALAIDPELAEARVNLALARLVSGDAAAAVGSLRAALAAGADQPEVHLGLADALRQLGRDREAIEQYRAALAARPGWAPAANDLAWLLATTGDPALREPTEALRWAERAAEASGRRDAAILDTLAVCQAAAGRTADARATLAKALELAEAAGNTALAADLRARLK